MLVVTYMKRLFARAERDRDAGCGEHVLVHDQSLNHFERLSCW